MGKGDYLGEFEQLVLLALMSMSAAEAYGMNIRTVLRDRAHRRVSVPTVYSTLDRLREKGYVEAVLGEATPERGGRAKKLFTVTDEGVAALRQARRTFDAMWAAADIEPQTS